MKTKTTVLNDVCSKIDCNNEVGDIRYYGPSSNWPYCLEHAPLHTGCFTVDIVTADEDEENFIV